MYKGLFIRIPIRIRIPVCIRAVLTRIRKLIRIRMVPLHIGTIPLRIRILRRDNATGVSDGSAPLPSLGGLRLADPRAGLR